MSRVLKVHDFTMVCENAPTERVFFFVIFLHIHECQGAEVNHIRPQLSSSGLNVKYDLSVFNLLNYNVKAPF